MERGQIAKPSPYVKELAPGTYFWCACGMSVNQPFCDGTHIGTNFEPFEEVVTATKKVIWCGCKQTGNAPYCDGSHRKF